MQYVTRFLAAVWAFALVAQLSAASDLPSEVRALLANGAWTQAVDTLEKDPKSKTDPELRELLGMAYLYSASNLDSIANLDKARTLMKQIVDSGGKARFLVSIGRDKKKEANLLDATPGELVVTSTYVEFQPQTGASQPPVRWEKKDIVECGPNQKYGKTSNSFHLTMGQRDKTEQNFRPWHFSAEEGRLVCSLIGVVMAPRR